MNTEIKILILLLVQRAENIIHTATSRYITREVLSGMKELPIWKLLSWTYIQNMTVQQIAGLGVIASFTLITFPVGVWLASFQIGKYYTLSASFSHIISMITIPLGLMFFNKTLGEMNFTRDTILGIVILEVAMILGAVGWYMIYRGNL